MNLESTSSCPPLWRQLQSVVLVVLDVRRGRSATAALADVPAPLRAGVQALSFSVLRNLGRARALRALLAPREPAPMVDALLCAALALDSAPQPAYEAHTLVNQTVEAAKRLPSARMQTAFINACLRRYLRERSALLARVQTDPLAAYNHPVWWQTRLQADWGDQAAAILAADLRPAPLTLRVNVRRVTRDQVLDALARAGLDAQPVGPYGVRLAQPCPVEQLPGFAAGWVSVQDAAAQHAAPLLLNALGAAPHGRWRVLDACAAPGGKTAHLLELADLDLTALDVDADRLQRVADNLHRLGLQARLLRADAGATDEWHRDGAFDAILLDAPCSASGIVRRHPDIVWLRREGDVAALARQQSRLLARLWPLLRPGGVLLYATCSVFRAEGPDVIAAFMRAQTDARQLPGGGLILPGQGWARGAVVDNAGDDPDGFFYALLHKTAP